jgi:hypothetical protein
MRSTTSELRNETLADPAAAEITRELAAAGVRTLAKKYHPDCGGDNSRMAAVNQAAEWLRSQARGLS